MASNKSNTVAGQGWVVVGTWYEGEEQRYTCQVLSGVYATEAEAEHEATEAMYRLGSYFEQEQGGQLHVYTAEEAAECVTE